MKYNNSTSNEGYSIITAILMIGFLLVLTVSTFNLVLQEMQDGRGREGYVKAYAGAEGAMELALLRIKERGYGFYEQKKDLEYFGEKNKNGLMSYDIDSEAQTYVGTLLQGEYSTDIIPLFTISDSGTMVGIRDALVFKDLNSAGLVWNVIGSDGGLSGIGDFDKTTKLGLRTLVGDAFNFEDATVGSLLLTPGSYLTVYNPTPDEVTYSVTVGTNELLTRPKSTIKSSSRVGKYSQNLDTTVDNSKFLGILKYSIYSGN